MPSLSKTLDVKLTRILADRSVNDFILADAKDADMAYGLSAAGLGPERHEGEARFKTLDEYRSQIREVVAQGLVDIMLMSVANSELLTLRERLFEDSPMTPAIRANDTTDIWLAGAEGAYGRFPSRPFRTASLDHAMCGHEGCRAEERRLGANLGLYSITFNNIPDRDYEALEAYKRFRIEAESKGFRHFLEVFSPNALAPSAAGGPLPEDVPRFVNNHIVRALAGVAEAGRPVFLKIPYFGPRAMEELVRYDSRLVVGILGGGAGTTLDAFQMLADAKRYGARVALYGRKINHAEHQLTFITFLRAIADGQIDPVEAVRAYHGKLQELGLRAQRRLEDDLLMTDSGLLSYSAQPAGNTRKMFALSGRTPVSAKPASTASPRRFDEAESLPDFSTMTPAEKLAWNLRRLGQW